MADDKKTLKFQMMMSPKEAETLDDWMFKNRVRSRAEAIRRLTQIALTVEPIVQDLWQVWSEIAKADGLIGDAIIEAKANLDRQKAETLLESFSRSHDKLTAPAMELGLQVKKVQAVFDALKAGDDVEETIRKVETENDDINRTRDFVRKTWALKEQDG